MEECQERMAEAVRSGAWLDYFRARTRWAELEDQSVPEAPPPEHTTRDPWPEGFAVPSGAAKLKKAAEAAGWEARVGYSRAWKAGVGRGVFHRCHYVTVQARRGSQGVKATWWAKADAEKLAWSFDRGAVNGWHTEKVGQITAALSVA